MKHIRSLSFLVFIISLLVCTILPSDLPAQARKKVFISDIQTRGVSRVSADLMKSGILSAILEHYGDSYTVISTDDIRQTLAIEEFKQVIGCSDEKCMQRLGDSIRTDEIIYGKIAREGQKIRLSLTNLEKDRNTLLFSTKNYVTQDCDENQVEWYSREMSRKLMNRRYQIRHPELADLGGEAVAIGTLSVEKGKDLDISIMDFSSRDTLISRIMPELRSSVAAGDTSYGEKDFENARTAYATIITDIENAIPASKRKDRELSKFISLVGKRIEQTYYMQAATDINIEDARVKQLDRTDTDTLYGSASTYRGIADFINNTPREYRTAKFTPLRTAAIERLDSVYSAICSRIGGQGDSLFRERKFNEAINTYSKAKNESSNISSNTARRRVVQTMDRKIDVAKKTGQNFLASRVNFLLDNAVVMNLKKDAPKARELLGKAETLINENRQFLTRKTESDYNEVARTMRSERLRTDSEVEQDRERAERQRQQQAREQQREERRKIGQWFYYTFLGVRYSKVSIADEKMHKYTGTRSANYFEVDLFSNLCYYFVGIKAILGGSIGGNSPESEYYTQYEEYYNVLDEWSISGNFGAMAYFNLPLYYLSHHLSSLSVFGGYGISRCSLRLSFHSGSSKIPAGYPIDPDDFDDRETDFSDGVSYLEKNYINNFLSVGIDWAFTSFTHLTVEYRHQLSGLLESSVYFGFSFGIPIGTF